MKKLFTLLSLSLCILPLFAQITLTSADMPAVGWVNVMHKDTLSGAVNFGNRGTNQVYNFSGFTNNVPDSLFYLAPTSTQLSSVPGATHAITADHTTYIFGKNQPTLFSYVGGQASFNGTAILTPFSPIDTGYKLPTVYGGKFRGTYGFTTTRPGSDFGQPSIYMVRITNTTTYTDTIDGSGTVTTPVGTYNCLRQHRVEHSSTLLEYSLCSFCGYQNVPTGATLPANPIVSTTDNYYYLTKETHGSVINFTYDSAGNPKSASWSVTPPTPKADFGYTVGTAGTVAFHDSSTGAPLTHSWNFGDNTPISTATSPAHTYSANGTYYVCETVTNVSGTNTYCDSVHITNIVAATPVAPTALDDTASVVQPGTVTINLTINDANNNSGSSICLDTTWGSPAGWVTVLNCSSVSYHPLDSTFMGLDTFYYRVCDVQVPTLCDTAMVVVEVKVPLVIRPVIGYSFIPNHCTFTFSDSTTNADSTVYHFSGLNGFPHDTVVSNPHNFIVPVTDGNLYICITAFYQNGTVSHCDTISTSCTGINEISSSQFSLYPNPAADHMLLDLSHVDQATMSEVSAVEIYDVLGSKMMTLPATTATDINVRSLSNGVYLIGLLDRSNRRRVLGKFEVMH